MLLYFFYGTWPWETKLYDKDKATGKRTVKGTATRQKPMIFWMHRRMITGRSRFSKNINIYFAKFIAAYKANADAWSVFLTDKGKGSPPLEYNIFLEDGLRYLLITCLHACVSCIPTLLLALPVQVSLREHLHDGHQPLK